MCDKKDWHPFLRNDDGSVWWCSTPVSVCVWYLTPDPDPDQLTVYTPVVLAQESKAHAVVQNNNCIQITLFRGSIILMAFKTTIYKTALTPNGCLVLLQQCFLFPVPLVEYEELSISSLA